MKKAISLTDHVKSNLPDDEVIYDLAETFKVFGDPTRTKILSCLSINSLKVGDIAEVCEMSVSAVSHHLRILRGAKLVKGRKEGKEVEYSLDDEHVEQILKCGLSHIND